jgi:hypothetical protein
MDGKQIVAMWKERWVVLVSVVVMLAAVPTGWIFGQKMLASVRQDVQKAVDADLAEIGSKGVSARLSYTVPAASPSDKPLEASFAPNQKMIDAFAALRQKQAEDLSGVVKVAGEFNRTRVVLEGREVKREPRGVLIEGLFPEPKEADQLKRRDFQRAYLEAAHQSLLKRFRAGGPPKGEDVLARLTEFKTNQLQQMMPGATDIAALPPDDQTRLEKKLVQFRASEYQRQARNLSFYADLEVFKLPAAGTEPPTLTECFLQQWEYWIREDLLAAAALANRDAADIGVPASALKRLESIEIDPPTRAASGESGGGSPPVESFGGVPLDSRVSVTGRISGGSSGNTLFDIRTVTLVAYVSTAQVPKFVDALASTNFMSVLDVDLAKVDPVAELAQGYYYGEEHVSKATIRIETVWLRGWMTPVMPPSVRSMLGIPLEPAPAEGGAAAPPG